MCAGLAGASLLLGCEAQRTNIVRTTRYPDGTEVHYSNTSSGYGYNPNVTVDVNSNVSANATGNAVPVVMGTGGWGYGGAVVPVAVPTIAPAIGPYWAPSTWPGPAWIPGTPYYQGFYGAGVYGPPIPNFGFGFGCR